MPVITLGEIEVDILKISKIVAAVGAILTVFYQGYGYGSAYLDKRIHRIVDPVKIELKHDDDNITTAMNVSYKSTQISLIDVKIDIRKRELTYAEADPNKNAVKIKTLNDDIRWLLSMKQKLKGL